MVASSNTIPVAPPSPTQPGADQPVIKSGESHYDVDIGVSWAPTSNTVAGGGVGVSPPPYPSYTTVNRPPDPPSNALDPLQALGAPPSPLVKLIGNTKITTMLDVATNKLVTTVIDTTTNQLLGAMSGLGSDPTALVSQLTQNSTGAKNALSVAETSLASAQSILADPNATDAQKALAQVNIDSANKTIASLSSQTTALTEAAAHLTDNFSFDVSQITDFASKIDSIANSLASGIDPVSLALKQGEEIYNQAASIFGSTQGTGSSLPFLEQVKTLDTSSVEIIPFTKRTNINTVSSIDNGGNDKAYFPTVPAANNIVNPGANSVANPSDRVTNTIANEPVREFEGLYPYNKSNKSESGHLLEVDDTPGKERILTEHKSGTYHEMTEHGDLITKVVNDNYLIIAENEIVTIQGKANLRILGDVNVKIGGAMIINPDGGVYVATKGDFRVHARSIHMEADSGDVNVKASGKTRITSGDELHVNSKNNIIESSGKTSMKSGGTNTIQAAGINFNSSKDVNLRADGIIASASTGDTTINSAGNLNAKAAGSINQKSAGSNYITASSLELNATLNAKATTNLQGTDPQGGIVTPINGSGAADAGEGTAAGVFVADDADTAKGSGITHSVNVDDFLQNLDDEDDVTRAAAIKHAVETGVISQADADKMNAPPGTPSASDTSGAGNVSPSVSKATVGDLGSHAPADNLKLSKYFTVAMLSSHCEAGSHVIGPQLGLSVTDITGNLQLLAQNCLDKIKDQYPDMRISSGFRDLASNNRTAGASKTSQHLKGEAVDIKFSHADKAQSQYYEIAKWIKNNIPFDQLILEYGMPSTDRPWIHISFTTGQKHSPRVSTKVHGKTVGEGLHQMR